MRVEVIYEVLHRQPGGVGGGGVVGWTRSGGSGRSRV